MYYDDGQVGDYIIAKIDNAVQKDGFDFIDCICPGRWIIAE